MKNWDKPKENEDRVQLLWTEELVQMLINISNWKNGIQSSIVIGDIDLLYHMNQSFYSSVGNQFFNGLSKTFSESN